MPMQRKQKKVQQFLEALKVGDRVVTTGGMYWADHPDFRQERATADRGQGRIEISRAAVAGYQGQEPVAPDPGNQ